MTESAASENTGPTSARLPVQQQQQQQENSGANDDDQRRLLTTPAHKLSKLIKEGKLSCARLCQAHIERIKLVQPKINAMAQDRFEMALHEANELDELLKKFKLTEGNLSREQLDMLESPLFGIPVSVKESIAVKGMRNSAGSWARRDTLAEEDAVVIKNIKRAGMIPICTSNVPEMTLFWADCNNLVYGRSRNPYKSNRITGSSSGGEAALLAAGATLCGVGSDIGGSLRNPAHYCGIMSHKPSPYLVSSEGNYPALNESRLRMFTLGPMCRYASDLRYLLKLLLADTKRDNPLQDSYKIYQPEDITQQRQRVLRELNEQTDSNQQMSDSDKFARVKFFYCDFKSASNVLSALFGQRELRVQKEIARAQREVLDHFASKFNCQLEQINLDKYLDKMFIMWQSMIACAGTVDRDKTFDPYSIKNMYGIKSVPIEVLKYLLGQSKHTKESLLSLMFGMPIPTNRTRAYRICEKFEKLASEMKQELESAMGQFGCIIMPTLPTVAHRHHYALLKTNEIRFPCLWNVGQMPVTHITIRLDKKHGLPYGMTIASRPFNDALTISIGEEIERTFGGWTPPPRLIADNTLGQEKKNLP